MKILIKTCVMYLKRKLRSCRIHIQAEKVCFIYKKWKKKKFSKFFPMSERTKKIFFSDFSKISKFFWKKASRGPRKYGKEQSHGIWAYLEGLPEHHERLSTRGGSLNPHPCRMGLRTDNNSDQHWLLFLKGFYNLFTIPGFQW